MNTDEGSASAAPPLDDAFWENLRGTLTASDEADMSLIDEEKAELIVTLLQKSYNKGIINTPDEIMRVTDQLKLISINDIQALDSQLVIISSRLDIPIVGISLTEQKVKKWRIIITYLFGAGLSIAAINAIVPIPFGLIAKSVFAGGVQAARVFFSSFAGTGANMTPEAIQNATAAAAAAPRGMVAGPSMDAVKALGGTIGKTLGSIIYTLSASALTKCVDVASSVVSGAAIAVTGACQLLSKENADRVADLAVLSATVKGITVGIDKGWDFVRELNSGRLDAAIAAIIDQGPVDAATNATINAILESTYNIEASKIGIKMNPQSSFSVNYGEKGPQTGIKMVPMPSAINPKIKPINRFLDVSIDSVINANFDQFIDDIEPMVPRPTDGSSKRATIMSDLSVLDSLAPNSKRVRELIQKYGMAVVMLYMILVNKSPEARPGFGKDRNSSSLPDTVTYGSKKVEVFRDSDSLPGDFKYREGTNPLFVAYELKNQILRDAGYPDSKSRFVGYIPDLTGKMNENVMGILKEPMDPKLPGDLYTAIAEKYLSVAEQREIVTYIIREFRGMTGQSEENDQDLFQKIAEDVRNMILRIPSDESMVVVEPDAAAAELPSNSLFTRVVGNRQDADPQKAAIKAEAAREAAEREKAIKAEAAREAARKAEAAEREKAREVAAMEAAAREKNQDVFSKKRKGGRRSRRKSRRHKKRRSTLKRRRMKRRRTRKGKKRRHTKKRR